ncbi:alpha/beta hydrolase family protein [Pedobacter aquatilis]|uniref:alpha/beta hydrolase family protein n=1 Tax=Pedobacter aquatilis TaxID=351343 RepID=UPI00292FB44B|nr:prolyl oligopeptidase family serine peptidase [Pedobacter aquatilis]
MQIKKILIKVTLLASVFLLNTNSKAQSNKIIDSLVISKWTTINDAKVSRSGKFFIFSLRDGKMNHSESIILKSYLGKSLHKADNTSLDDAFFSSDSNFLVYKSETNFFKVFDIIRGSYVLNVEAQKLEFISVQDKEYVVYLNSNTHRLSLQGLTASDKNRKLNDSVENYWVDGGVLWYLRNAGGKNRELVKILFDEDKERVVWSGEDFSNCIPGNDGKLMILTTGNRGTILLLDKSSVTATKLISGTDLSTQSSSKIDEIDFFSMRGRFVVFTLSTDNLVRKKITGPQLDLWSYRDSLLMDQQLAEIPNNTILRQKVAVDIATGEVRYICNVDESIISSTEDGKLGVFLVEQKHGDKHEDLWNENGRSTITFINLLSKSSHRIPKIQNGTFSKTKRYITGHGSAYGGNSRTLFSFDTFTSTLVSVDSLLSNILPFDTNNYIPRQFLSPEWFEDDKSMIISFSNDKDDSLCNDLFLVDMTDYRIINITGGEGLRKNIRFRIAQNVNIGHLRLGQEIVLSAHDKNNKFSGFYSVLLGKPSSLSKLFMGPYYFESISRFNYQSSPRFLVKKGDDRNSNNFFISRKLTEFSPITFNHPESKVRWQFGKIFVYHGKNGIIRQTTAYFPEDFDSTKTYPAIFHYYERLTQNTYRSKTPMFSTGAINIPWFTSRGYIVITPDIEFEIGNTGESALSAITDAADFFKSKFWINGSKLGLQGHSFGGYQTNYVLTHTNIFAAALSASGISNLITWYGQISGGGSGFQFFMEGNPLRLASTPWERPDLYIKNSPLFFADKISTPLLMMHCKKDGVAPFSQGIEFYMALRRLGKIVWLLQYDNGNHLVFGEDSYDYTTRSQQFFDYYLKDTSAPRWMVQGIPATSKGKSLATDLMPNGVTPRGSSNTKPDTLKIKEYSRKPFQDKVIETKLNE